MDLICQDIHFGLGEKKILKGVSLKAVSYTHLDVYKRQTKEFYETINKYIDQKLSEKDSQKDLVKENEADKD